VPPEEPVDSVRTDDQDAGTTPLRSRLMPGRHTLSITGPDGRSSEQQIEVKGRRMDLAVDLPRQAGGPATLAVHSEPSEANVLVDGTLLGRTPYQGPLQPGEHTVAGEMEGILRQQLMVFALAGR